MAKLDESLVPKAAAIVKKMMGDYKDSDISEEIAEKLKISISTAFSLLYPAEAVAFPELKFKATSANVKKARDKEGLRWERIAARCGVSPAMARQLYADSGGDPSGSYIGRGRKPGDNGASAEKPKRGRGRPKKEEVGVQVVARRGRGRPKKEEAAAKPVVRRRRRADVAADRP